MLPAALRRHSSNGSLNQFKQRLLHSLARHISRDRGIVRLARDLIDLVDVNDSNLGLLHIVIALLQQLLNDILNVFPDVAGFCEGRRICYGKRHVQLVCQSLCQECFS